MGNPPVWFQTVPCWSAVGEPTLTTRPPDPSKLDKWRREMQPADLAAYNEVAGERLRELGYEVTA